MGGRKRKSPESTKFQNSQQKDIYVPLLMTISHLLMLCTKTGNEIFKISYTGSEPEIQIVVNLSDFCMI